MSDRTSIDRDHLIAELRCLLPDPVSEELGIDGSLTLVGGDPGEVIVRVTGGKVSIAEYTVRWEGPHTPTVRPKQLATLQWKRLPAALTAQCLFTLIQAAHDVRRARYGKCERCGEMNPPEWMHDDGICQSCAERHLGVVH